MNSKREYKVTVKCFTYNQASYIEETLNGFCIQETDYPFVCVIMDDASTDGEANVIRNYMNENFCLWDNDYLRQEETEDYILTFAQHKKNKNCFFAVFYLKYNHWSVKIKEPYAAEWLDHSDYVAICEGDDYWTDPRKLQKQSDVLDNNPSVSMVYTAFKTVNEKSIPLHRPRYDRYLRRSRTGNILPELFYSNFILTLTIMLRREILHSNLYLDTPNKYDYSLSFAASFLGKCFFIPDVTGCYRKSAGSSITSRISEVERGLYRVYRYFADQYFNGECEEECTMFDKAKIYRNMLVNMFFNSDYQYVKRVVKHNPLSSLLIPESFVFSFLKKLKWKTYGSIDR